MIRFKASTGMKPLMSYEKIQELKNMFINADEIMDKLEVNKMEQKTEEKKKVEPWKKMTISPWEFAIWDNVNKEGGHFKTLSMERSYKDKNDEWKKTGTLRESDFIKVIMGLWNGYTMIVASHAQNKGLDNDGK